jgi:hypothetical protein
MSLEIIALKRPPKLKPAIADPSPEPPIAIPDVNAIAIPDVNAIAIPAPENAPEAPIATPSPKKIIPQPKTRTGTRSKQPPKLRLGADGEPMYRAIGCFSGILKLKGKPVIVLEDGSKVAIAGIRDQKLLLWLLNNVERWQGNTAHWLVYPNGKRFTVLGMDQDGKFTRNQFLIRGNFRSNPEPGSFSVFIGRNYPRSKEFCFVNVMGHFQTGDRALIDAQCEWVDGCLHLVNAIAVK